MLHKEKHTIIEYHCSSALGSTSFSRQRLGNSLNTHPDNPGRGQLLQPGCWSYKAVKASQGWAQMLVLPMEAFTSTPPSLVPNSLRWWWRVCWWWRRFVLALVPPCKTRSRPRSLCWSLSLWFPLATTLCLAWRKVIGPFLLKLSLQVPRFGINVQSTPSL